MGREITGVKQEKKINGVVVGSNGLSTGKIHVSPKISERISRIESKEYKLKDSNEEKAAGGEGLEKQDVLVVKSTNLDDHLAEEKNEKLGTQSSNSSNSSSPVSKAAAFENGHSNHTVPLPVALATERAGTCEETVRAEVATSENYSIAESPNANKTSQTPNAESPICTKSLEVQFCKILVVLFILFFIFVVASFGSLQFHHYDMRVNLLTWLQQNLLVLVWTRERKNKSIEKLCI